MLDLTIPTWIRNKTGEPDAREIAVISWQSATHAVCVAGGIVQPLLIDLVEQRILNGDYQDWAISNDTQWAEIADRGT